MPEQAARSARAGPGPGRFGWGAVADARRTRDSTDAAMGQASVVAGGFVEKLALFLRTVPVYPPGHGRVKAAAQQLVATLLDGEGALVIDVTPDGLTLGDVPIDARSGHAKMVRDALDATGVARVVIDRAAPLSSFTMFARSLGRNARLASPGKLTFEDLWVAPIEGIKVLEQVYDTNAFTGIGAPETGPALDSAVSVDAGLLKPDAKAGHGGGGSGAAKTPGTGEGEGGGLGPEKGPGVGTGAARGGGALRAGLDGGSPLSRTVSRDLRRLVREDPILAPLLARVEQEIIDRGEVGWQRARHDVLEQIIRILPIEARLDPAKGIAAIHRVLERFSASLGADPAGPGAEFRRCATLLMRAVQAVFPTHLGEEAHLAKLGSFVPRDAGGPSDPAEDALVVLERISLPLDRANLGDGPPVIPSRPELSEETGIRDYAGVEVSALLEEPDPHRRECMRRDLVGRLRDKDGRDVECVLVPLGEAAAAPEESRDLERVRLLGSVVAEAGIVPHGAAWLTPEVVAETFPVLFGPYVLSGKSAGVVCRLVGRDAVIAAAQTLREAGGALHGGATERVLQERSRDVLPLLEVLLESAVSDLVTRAMRALRNTRLPQPAAAVLRVLADAPGAVDLHIAIGLCQDGFEGVDSGRFDKDAVASLAEIAVGGHRASEGARIYATTALGDFGRVAAQGIVRGLLRRRWGIVPAEPRKVRRAAEAVIARWTKNGGRATSSPGTPLQSIGEPVEAAPEAGVEREPLS